MKKVFDSNTEAITDLFKVRSLSLCIASIRRNMANVPQSPGKARFVLRDRFHDVSLRAH